MTPKLTPKAMKYLLIGSLAVNLAVLGLMVGAALSHEDRRGGDRTPARMIGAVGAPPELGLFARSLDRSDRRELRQRLRADDGLRNGLSRIRGNRDAVVAALRAQPFDPAALEAAIAQQRQLQTDLADRGKAVLIDLITDMSDADRAAFADRLASQRGRGDRHRKSD